MISYLSLAEFASFAFPDPFPAPRHQEPIGTVNGKHVGKPKAQIGQAEHGKPRLDQNQKQIHRQTSQRDHQILHEQ